MPDNKPLYPAHEGLIKIIHNYMNSEATLASQIDSIDDTGLVREYQALTAKLDVAVRALEEIKKHPLRTPVMGRKDFGIKSILACQETAENALKAINETEKPKIEERYE